jgi:hypothetical protein
MIAVYCVREDSTFNKNKKKKQKKLKLIFATFCHLQTLEE